MAEEEKKATSEPVDPATLGAGQDGPYYTKSTAQLDRERRTANENRPEAAPRLSETDDPVLDPTQVYAPYATESTDTSGYVGVSPEYMTHANDTEKPLRAEDGAEAEVEDRFTTGGLVSDNPVPTTPGATEGGGSSRELIYSATSGEDFQSEVTDREETHRKAQDLADEAGQDEQVSHPVTSPSVVADTPKTKVGDHPQVRKAKEEERDEAAKPKKTSPASPTPTVPANQ